MSTASLALGLLAALSLPVPAQEPAGPTLAERFEALDDAGDVEGVVELWRAHPHEVLYTIDAYLEKSLAVWENHRDEPSSAERIERLEERALRGALAADRAFSGALFSDYASSFVGWNDEQKRAFREGQKAYGAAQKALRAGEPERVLEHARRCVDLAEPLGDWWGTAMGLTGIGMAHEELGAFEEALRAHSRARLLHAQLRLAGSEYRNLLALARILDRLDRRPRALISIERGLELGAALGDADGRVELLRLRATIEERDGDLPAAKRTLEELKALLEEMQTRDE